MNNFHFIKKRLDNNTINGLALSCSFDMCALEGKSNQNDYRCSAYATLVGMCYDYATKNNLNWDLSIWRDSTNCRNFFYDLKLN